MFLQVVHYICFQSPSRGRGLETGTVKMNTWKEDIIPGGCEFDFLMWSTGLFSLGVDLYVHIRCRWVSFKCWSCKEIPVQQEQAASKHGLRSRCLRHLLVPMVRMLKSPKTYIWFCRLFGFLEQLIGAEHKANRNGNKSTEASFSGKTEFKTAYAI